MHVSTPAQKSPNRQVWAIAGPAILANSSAPMLGLVDTWAVGHLPGAVHLAAVGLGSVIFNYFFWAFGFLRMGTTGLVAQARGKGDPVELCAIVLRSSALALVCGLGLLLVQELLLGLSIRAMAPPDAVAAITAEYFQIRIWSAPAALLVYALTGVLFGLARTVPVLVLQLILNITNAGLNLLFVVGLGLGVPGVALGTLIAQWLSAVVAVWMIVNILGAKALRSGLASGTTWLLHQFRRLILINGFIFIRTIFLMTALAIIMRVAGGLGEVEMAASHVVSQYMLLMALGLDGFAHASEALAGSAWGDRNRQEFRRWVVISGYWAVIASLVYAVLFWLGGGAITAVLTDIEPVRETVGDLMPLIIALPVVAIWCYLFDGVYIGATAAAAMMTTMGVAFVVYLGVLGPMTNAWGLGGLWGAVLIFMAVRGLAQAIWYPRLEAQLE